MDDFPYATAFVPNQEFTGVVPLKEGFLRGSIFNNLYMPYNKEFVYTLNTTNPKLRNLQAIAFYLLDLNLYLDNHPNDAQAHQVFTEYSKKYNSLLKEYEQDYGPITIRSDSLDEVPWKWNEGPWPWERKANE